MRWHKRKWKLVPKAIVTVLAVFIFLVAVVNSSTPESITSSTTTGQSVYAQASQATSAYTQSSEISVSDTTILPTTEQTTTVAPSAKPAATTRVTTTSPTTTAPAITSKMKIHFLDVGQGAATLFEIGDKTMIIDGGDQDKSSFVVAYLKKIGIKQVDVMIASHYDADHINGLVGVLNVFPVLQVYDANCMTTSRVYNSFKNFVKDNAIPEAIPGMRQSIQVGEATVTFIAPKYYGHDEVNDDSICVRVQFGETSFLIMGDPSANAEQQILSQTLDSDVFYAAHHGSDGSNSKTLLANVSPEYVVISCGAENSYGHPGHNTISRIKNTGAALYRTDKQGTIICTSDGDTLTWGEDPCNDFTLGTTTIANTASTTTAPASTSTTSATTIPPATGGAAQAYVLNTNTHKFHYPACGSAATIKPANRQDVVRTRDEILAMGFLPCGNCDP